MAKDESKGELSGSKAPKIDKRTDKIAREAGEKAQTGARELLDRHTDVLDPNIIRIIQGREFERAFQNAKAARAEGRMNDNSNQTPGLTALITKEGFEGLTEVVEKGNATYVADYVAGMEPADSDGKAYSLRLPEGTYVMGFGGATFYGEVTMEEGQQVSREKPFSMPYGAVVRIEGDGGELWQNVNFQPDGTPRDR